MRGGGGRGSEPPATRRRDRQIRHPGGETHSRPRKNIPTATTTSWFCRPRLFFLLLKTKTDVGRARENARIAPKPKSNR